MFRLGATGSMLQEPTWPNVICCKPYSQPYKQNLSPAILFSKQYQLHEQPSSLQVVDMDRLDALTLRQLQSFVGATGVTSDSPDPDEDPDADDGDGTVLWPQVGTLDSTPDSCLDLIPDHALIPDLHPT